MIDLPDFWLGVFALPAGAAALFATFWLLARSSRMLVALWRRVRPQTVHERHLYSLDAHGRVTNYKVRAPLAAAVLLAPRTWVLKVAPRWSLMLIVDADAGARQPLYDVATPLVREAAQAAYDAEEAALVAAHA